MNGFDRALEVDDVFHVKIKDLEWVFTHNESAVAIHCEATRAGMRCFVDQHLQDRKGVVLFYREDGRIEATKTYPKRVFNPEAPMDLVGVR
ncbi:MAG: hypothetical protein U0984_06825 [Prosthecobacter sp.]|nr:hypothetical protein [Prosthecobacter sp.]